MKKRPERVLHGGKKRFLEMKHGTKYIDFSASLNPFPPHIEWSLDEAVLESYPDDSYSILKEEIGRVFQREVDEITVGNGSIELIRSFCFSVLQEGDRVLVQDPTFGEYRYSTELAGGVCVAGPERLRARFLCNPNNPTGHLLTKDQVREILESLPVEGAYLFVDEAFIELSDPVQSMVDIRDERLLVARSLTKSFAVPGIRFGFGFGIPELVEGMEAYRLPWSVNAHAEAFALQAFHNYHLLEVSRIAISKERSWLQTRCRDIGIPYEPSEANFLLLHLPLPAKHIWHRLLTRGIIVRDCSSFGLPSAIRIAVRTHEENSMLMEALEECLP
jgi:threonine-phosphate decarboxylase